MSVVDLEWLTHGETPKTLIEDVGDAWSLQRQDLDHRGSNASRLRLRDLASLRTVPNGGRQDDPTPTFTRSLYVGCR